MFGVNVSANISVAIFKEICSEECILHTVSTIVKILISKKLTLINDVLYKIYGPLFWISCLIFNGH
jgi:hypothetical protein